MALFAKVLKVITLLTIVSSSSVQAAEILTIERAVQTALEHDSLINVYQFRRDAYREQAIAEDTLPDPKN